MKSTKFYVPIYRANITVYLGEDLKYISDKYKTSNLSNYGAVTMVNPNNPFKNYIVGFSSAYDNGLIAHEVVHLVNHIFLDVGMQLDRQNDEAQAYLTGFLFDKIEEFLKKYRRK
jgi:hypothetical protein